MSDFEEKRSYVKSGYVDGKHAYNLEISGFEKLVFDLHDTANRTKRGTGWCIYLYVFKDALPNLFERLDKYLGSYYDSEDIDAIEFYKGCTYTKKPNGNCIKIGCDFSHPGDAYYENTPMDEWQLFVPIVEKYEANLIKLINKYDRKEVSA